MTTNPTTPPPTTNRPTTAPPPDPPDIDLEEWIENVIYLPPEEWTAAAIGYIVTTPAGKLDATLLFMYLHLEHDGHRRGFADWLIDHFGDEARVTRADP